MEAAVAQIHPAIAELRPGQRFEGRYACLTKERQTARNGSTYLSVRLRDRSGSISARAFREADRIGLRFDAGDAVSIRGRVERYRGDELEGFLEHLAREVHDPALRALVDAVVFSGPLAADFRRAPATRRSHHAYLGGLLEHTVAVATLVLETCALHPKLDSDLLMAAAIGPGRARPGRGRDGSTHGFASAEALALCRLNALDASVKGALEHG